MDSKSNAITLYTLQSPEVLAALKRDGQCFSREEYIRAKYGESAPIFLTAYRWLAGRAPAYVPKPEGAELHYWAFKDKRSLDLSGGGSLLTLKAPREEALFFDMYEWGRILQLKYLGESPAEERAFSEELALRGLNESKVALSAFYPDFRRQITDSWERLLRHHSHIVAGDCSGVGAVQAALWRIRAEWITEITK